MINEGKSAYCTVDILKKYNLIINHWDSTTDKRNADAINIGWDISNG